MTYIATDGAYTVTIPNSSIIFSGKILREMLRLYRDSVRKVSVGRYESEVEALLLFIHGMHHVSAVVDLSRSSLDYLPSAMAAARAALETNIRAAWLVDEDDPFLREARYVAYLKTDIHARQRILDKIPSKELESLLNDIKHFHSDLERKLEDRGYTIPSQIPKFPSMLSAIVGRDVYWIYIMASQYTHGGHFSTALNRKGLGHRKNIRFDVDHQYWIDVFRVCIEAMNQPARILLQRIGIEPPYTDKDTKTLMTSIRKNFSI